MDNVSDSLIRIKNGYLAKKEAVELIYSKLILSICELLEKEDFLSSVKNDKNKIIVGLKYNNKQAVLTDIRRVSKPGLRVYKGKNDLPKVLNGLGLAIVSTPKGVLTDKDARKEGVGGEIIAYVW